MNENVQLAEDGIVQLPHDLLQRLGWTAGTLLEMVVTDDGLQLHKVSSELIDAEG
jgi:bifunctional DNA-binding transcriptional regulator/antitoxin component of YhaV-PrlF toxin-antitoxin module